MRTLVNQKQQKSNDMQVLFSLVSLTQYTQEGFYFLFTKNYEKEYIEYRKKKPSVSL